MGRPKELFGFRRHLALPLADLSWMYLILGGEFIDCVQPFQRLQGHLRFKIGTMSNPLLAHASPPSSSQPNLTYSVV